MFDSEIWEYAMHRLPSLSRLSITYLGKCTHLSLENTFVEFPMIDAEIWYDVLYNLSTLTIFFGFFNLFLQLTGPHNVAELQKT